MDNPLLIILLAVSVSILVLLVVILIRMNKQEDQDSPIAAEQLKSNLELKSQLASFERTIPAYISESISKQMVSVTESFKTQNEQDAQRLLSFENVITSTLNSRIDALNKKVDDNLSAINAKVDKSLSEGFKSNADTMATIREQLGAISEAQQNIKSLSNEVVGLKGVLTNNQQRGRYGEMQLEMILAATFGETKGTLYDLQYVLVKKEGEEESLKPDAVVFLDGSKLHNIIAIDSKFSLVGYEALFGGSNLSESETQALKMQFKNAIKQRIKETSKYIVPGLTVRNAIMFIPNDGIFAFIENEFPDVVEDALNKGVVLASPTILQPMIVSFRVVQADAEKSKNLEKINASLASLSIEFDRFMKRWNELSRAAKLLNDKTVNLDTTVNKIDKRFASINVGKELIAEEEPLLEIGD